MAADVTVDPALGASPLDPSGASNPLSRKLNKILDTRLDNDKETLEALKALSTFFTENSLRARRNLRGDIEKRSLAINDEFLSSLKRVKDQLDNVHSDVQSMNDCCQDMISRLAASKSQTRDLINQTTQLQAESQRIQMKMMVANAFLAKFQLSADQMKTLRASRDAPIGSEFFAALKRVKEIHTDCKILLRSNHQTAGWEIMESMAVQQEAAYERLFRWAQGECRTLTSDSPDVSANLCEAMAALQERPVLLKYTLEEFCSTRRAAVVRAFIDALTRGGPGGSPRPIELHSHDPMRYVGDILAWLHQACASEHDHLSALFRFCEQSGIEKAIREPLTPITEGLCRPFKVRVEQVLVSELAPVVLYKLHNLIQFFHITISQFLYGDAPMMATILEIRNLSTKMFHNSLSFHASKLTDQVEPPTEDLAPKQNLLDTLRLLQDILSCQDSTVLSVDVRQSQNHEILRSVIEPLINMCTVSASKLNTIEMAVYMVNCLYKMHTVLSLYEYTEHLLQMLQAQVDAHLDTLISENASFILGKIGLSFIYTTIQRTPQNVSSLPDADGKSVRAAMLKFDQFMTSPDIYNLPQMMLLQAPKNRDLVKTQAHSLLYTVYEVIYKAVHNPEQGYQNPASIVTRTPDQVKTLLQLF